MAVVGVALEALGPVEAALAGLGVSATCNDKWTKVMMLCWCDGFMVDGCVWPVSEVKSQPSDEI
jgi:hypothetical protein